MPAASSDPFIHQELTELMYHTLWETVHVFFEQQSIGHDVGASAFLYPFLGEGQKPPADTLSEVAHRFFIKRPTMNGCGARWPTSKPRKLRRRRSDSRAITERRDDSWRSATAARRPMRTISCSIALRRRAGIAPIPAISLSMEPANISAIANDVGVELVFMRQMIAVAGRKTWRWQFRRAGNRGTSWRRLIEARKRGMLTVALLGSQGGDILRDRLADHALSCRRIIFRDCKKCRRPIYHVLRAGAGTRCGDTDGAACSEATNVVEKSAHEGLHTIFGLGSEMNSNH